MAASSLLALIDDIATLLDDVAVLTKVASTKTAGVLGDDLALNAKQVTGVSADRELPVVWAVAKGSIKNKFILVPAALLISAVAPWAITPLLMTGGAYLCYEGFEKLVHTVQHLIHAHSDEETAHAEDLMQVLENPAIDLVAFEKDKITGAIRTDFVLSAEIIAITLGTVVAQSLLTQLSVLTTVSLLITVGVYGIVAGIVKIDDLGLYLNEKTTAGLLGLCQRGFGLFLLNLAPYLMKSLSVIGTVAMFMVGGSILVHGAAPLHEVIHTLTMHSANLPFIGSLAHSAMPTVLDMFVGILAGAVTLLAATISRKIFSGTT